MALIIEKQKVYATEPLMHAGDHYAPGEAMDCDPDDTFAILAAGRGTLKIEVAKEAARIFAMQQKSGTQAK